MLLGRTGTRSGETAVPHTYVFCYITNSVHNKLCLLRTARACLCVKAYLTPFCFWSPSHLASHPATCRRQWGTRRHKCFQGLQFGAHGATILPFPVRRYPVAMVSSGTDIPLFPTTLQPPFRTYGFTYMTNGPQMILINKNRHGTGHRVRYAVPDQPLGNTPTPTF